MSPSERKAMINADRTDLSLTKQCKLLKIRRSSLYYAPVGVNAETLKLMNEIDRVFTKYPFFGSRQIAAYLPRNGFHAGRHRVRRLMGVIGLQAIYKGPNTRRPATHACMCERGQEASSAPDLSIPAAETANHAPKPCLPLAHEDVRCRAAGAAISPIFRSGADSFIWWQSWIGQRVRCWRSGSRIRWMPAFVSRL